MDGASHSHSAFHSAFRIPHSAFIIHSSKSLITIFNYIQVLSIGSTFWLKLRVVTMKLSSVLLILGALCSFGGVLHPGVSYHREATKGLNKPRYYRKNLDIKEELEKQHFGS